MKKLSLKPNAFDKGEVLTRAQLKKVMGGTGSGDDGSTREYCTYSFKDGSQESGWVTNPPDSGYAFPSQYAEAFCKSDPTCAYVDCGH